MRVLPRIVSLLGALMLLLMLLSTLLCGGGCRGRVALEPVRMGEQARRSFGTRDVGAVGVKPRAVTGPAAAPAAERLKLGVWIPHWHRARDIHRLMSSPDARRKHVADIVKLVVKRRFHGVDIDYEGKLMAYDQWFAEHGATSWTSRTRGPRAPNADLVWVQKVVQHFVRFVDSRISALSHVRLQRLKRRFRGRTSRTLGGELALDYKRQGVHRVGTVCDARCVRDRIRLAERLGLRGVVLFKIEGEEDPQLWPMLQQERKRLQNP